MSDRITELEIFIRSTADARGITITNEESRKLATTLHESSRATEGAGKAAEHAATSTKHLGMEVKHMSHLGHEAEGVLMGLERGGLSGLAQAGTNAARIIRSLASGTIGAILIPSVIVVTGLLKVLSVISEKNEEVMKKMWDAAAERSEKHKKTVEENTKALEKEYTKQAKKLKEVIEEYDLLSAAIDRADKRRIDVTAAKRDKEDATTELAKQRELSKATTPEARAAIEDKYAGRKILTDRDRAKVDAENQDHANDLRIKEETGRIDAARADIRAHQKIVDGAHNKKDEAQEKANIAIEVDKKLNTNASAEAKSDALKEAVAAKENVTKAEKDFAEHLLELGKVIAEAEAKIAAARTEREVNAIKASLPDTTAKAKAVELGNKNTDRVGELGTIATQAQAAGNSTLQAQAVTERNKLLKAANDLRKATGEHAEAVSNSLTATAKDLEKQKYKLQLAQQASPGGGG